MTRKWNDWRGRLTIQIKSDNAIVPKKSAIEVKRKHLTAHDLGDQYHDAPNDLTREVKLKLNWLREDTKTRLELPNSVVDARNRRGDWDNEVTRKLLVGYSKGSKNWEISGKASVAETVSRKGENRFREREFGLETSFAVSPQNGELLTIDAELDCANLPNDQGLTVEEASLSLSSNFDSSPGGSRAKGCAAPLGRLFHNGAEFLQTFLVPSELMACLCN